jgi:hypothetical protein
VANLPFYAFGLCVAPHADPGDAALDLIGIEAPTRRAVLAALRELRPGAAAAHLGAGSAGRCDPAHPGALRLARRCGPGGSVAVPHRRRGLPARRVRA